MSSEYNYSVIKHDKIISDLSIKEILADADVSMFHLHEQGGDHNIAVDLETGMFYLGAYPLNPGMTFQDVEYRLIYYKRSRMEIGWGGKEEQFIHRYLLGWQATIEGENYQRIMFLDPSNHMIEVQSKR